MLSIKHEPRDIPKREYFNHMTQEFIEIPGVHINAINLQLEHSLMSIAKWESKWHESFMNMADLSGEQLLDYIRCMTINPQKDPNVYEYLTQADITRIVEYMQDPMSAWIPKTPMKKQKTNGRKRRDTSESIYYAMIQFGIPFECEKWHFNRLMALIHCCGENGVSYGGGGGPKKSQRELMEMYRAMNEANRKKYHSKG